MDGILSGNWMTEFTCNNVTILAKFCGLHLIGWGNTVNRGVLLSQLATEFKLQLTQNVLVVLS